MDASPPLALQDYKPRSRLHAAETQKLQPRYPVIDAHNHLGEIVASRWHLRPVGELLDCLDQAGVRCIVDLDGGWGEHILQARLDKFKNACPERFCCFGGVDWAAWGDHGDRFGEWAAGRLRIQTAWGAQGLKIWKGLGLTVRDPHGELAPVDDPRLDPIWAAAAELHLPVIIHVGDPVAFFDPLDAHNERWEELHAHPDWHFPSPPFPPFLDIMAQLERLVARHPQTTFIGAHVGCYAENLDWVSRVLASYPNFSVDIAARISELGRQPYRARRFFLEFSERILFGIDVEADPAVYQIYYRFLQTEDEYFDYSLEQIPPQGRWRIYGLNLPEAVLAQVYQRNAGRLLGV